ncbi:MULTISPECIES: alanine racemase [unclassified Crossiella]|uniref:alanine racemase n=1 Tax=unclassified Crossiella TaxID=2620835 RepID=UPI001FFE72C1|nr:MULTISPECIES: alanine racemase [unclassified Crossiella]MCK2236922.1 alanine racemase [Crossiella sp. S99.2]MCK2250590.1 alanine racemase [Crossiella sp. S99.1]
MADQTRAARAETVIDTDALRHNYAYLSALAAESEAATMAVVKADGYGHGAVEVARVALTAGVTWLGTAAIEEALELRAAGITAPLLCWLYPAEQDFTEAIAADIDLSVSSMAELTRVLAGAEATGRIARIHLKVDTGLSRNGAEPGRWRGLFEAAAKAQADGVLKVIGLWSHLASADEPASEATGAQYQIFLHAYRLAVELGLTPLRHLANSAATLLRDDLHFDLVRVGIAGYGLNPVPGHGGEQLRPAMTFRSSVARVKRVPAGTGVSYGLTWTAPVETSLALVPVGYADGVPRALSGRMDVQINGSRLPVVGRVCMDQIVVDCGEAKVAEGDEVILFGPGDQGEPTAQEWADKIGTIHYEIVTGMYRPRVKRSYRGRG